MTTTERARRTTDIAAFGVIGFQRGVRSALQHAGELWWVR